MHTLILSFSFKHLKRLVLPITDGYTTAMQKQEVFVYSHILGHQRLEPVGMSEWCITVLGIGTGVDGVTTRTGQKNGPMTRLLRRRCAGSSDVKTSPSFEWQKLPVSETAFAIMLL